MKDAARLSRRETRGFPSPPHSGFGKQLFRYKDDQILSTQFDIPTDIYKTMRAIILRLKYTSYDAPLSLTNIDHASTQRSAIGKRTRECTITFHLGIPNR